MTTNFFSPFSFVAVFGSRIQDPGSEMGKNQDPGSGKNIPDPQHCLQPVFRIRIHRIHMFLALPAPDPLVRGMDSDPAPDPSIIMQN
jgi:hypothetical protein